MLRFLLRQPISLIHDFWVTIFARRMFYRFNRALFGLSLRGMGLLNCKSTHDTGEDFLISKFLPRQLDLVIDVGANEGSYAINFKKHISVRRMICFEPHPETFKKLVNNVSHLEVEVVNMGIGDSNQPMTLFDYADKDGSAHASLYKAVIENIHGGASISHKVEMTTLDSFAHDNGISQIDFVKIDVEGYELSVLKGMKELISSRKVGYVQVEFNEMNAVSKTFFEDICSHLPFHKPHRLLPHGMIDLSSKSIVERNLFAFQNIIFIPVDYKTSLYGNAAYADEKNREY